MMKRILSTRVPEKALSIGLLILRIGSGFLMMANHGYGKLAGFAEKSQKFKYDVFGLGSATSFSLVVFAEFFCAAFIILGLFTRFASIPLIVTMCVAFVSAHKMNYSGGPGGGELSLLFLTCFITLLITGPGRFSLDRFIAK